MQLGPLGSDSDASKLQAKMAGGVYPWELSCGGSAGGSIWGLSVVDPASTEEKVAEEANAKIITDRTVESTT